MTKLISQVAHVELITPVLEESVAFFRDLVGLEVTERVGDSVYLRTWGDYFHHTIVLTAGEKPALGHVGWRAQGPDELQEAARRLEESGQGIGWIPAGVGHGPAYRFAGPNGQIQEVFWEVDRYEAPDDLKSVFPARPQRYTGRGATARYLDHVNFPAADPVEEAKWYHEVLGSRFLEWTQLSDAPVSIFATLASADTFDLALLRDDSGIFGRFHHLALWVDERNDVIRAAELFREHGVTIEWGPGRHGHGESMSVYVREPGGMRVEIVSGGYRNVQPDWEPRMWHPEDGSADFYLSNPLPEAFLEVLPPIDDESTITVGDSGNPWGKK
ncbi:VOC family protein [Leifsonia sp. NPDC058194]|uniref:VOC family protein n=1 Tax=Leifsonia sp. NPDC058194 TaxID=3346374 RepID=UPI0036D7640A